MLVTQSFYHINDPDQDYMNSLILCFDVLLHQLLDW